VRQAEDTLAHRGGAKPVFFYTQPKNVHQFAHNDLPLAKESNWPAQPGFNYRISFEVHQVDECLGEFFAWMKAHGLYDNSIIIVTSDHGDATGEFGRSSHSLVIYPEIMRVPLIVHLPKTMQGKLVHDDNRISALIDIAPSLYYLLGHRPIIGNPLFGHPLFAKTLDELRAYHRDELFMASDVHAAYGILAEDGKYLYATYDSPARSELYDLEHDPNAQRNVVTPQLKRQYDERVIEYLHRIADFYGYKPGIGSLLSSSR
jgi:arylsulfatase A-like enzyme